ncbi:MAG TPA: hypothetical protein VM143_06365 [Acidimicrobiales bacterium]|nr:hypothetical protein [Acidimicrobiales bacterium]
MAEATPVAPLWFLLLRVVLRRAAETPAAVRSVAGVLLALGPASVAVLTVSLVRDRLRPIAAAGAGVAVALLVFGGRFSGEIFSYLNQYGFESGASLLALASCCSATRDRPLPWHLAVALVVVPAAAIGGVLLMPGVVVVTAFRVLRTTTGRGREVLRLVATVAASGGSALVSYLTMYRAPLGRDSTVAFFIGDRFSGSISDVAPAVRDLVVGSLRWAGFGPMQLLAVLSLIGLAALSWRRPVVVITILVAIASLMVVSRATGFPATANRVNAPLMLLIASVPCLGAVEIALAVAGWLRVPAARYVSVAVLLLLGVGLWRPPSDEPPYKPLRGLTQDLYPITVTAHRSNVIVAYHWYTKWWVHDLFVNQKAGGDRTFRMLAEDHFGGSPEAQIRQPVYTDIRRLVEAQPGEPTAVWCVLPFETGPEAFDAACDLSGMGWTRTELPKGERSRIILWESRHPG